MVNAVPDFGGIVLISSIVFFFLVVNLYGSVYLPERTFPIGNYLATGILRSLQALTKITKHRVYRTIEFQFVLTDDLLEPLVPTFVL